jgi:CHY zinc finger
MEDSMEIDGAASSNMDYQLGERVVTLSGGDYNQGIPRPPMMVHRSGSMSQDEERQRRASIKAILADERLPMQERRRSIQNLMDGRRSSIGTASVASTASTTYGDDDPYGYGDPEAYQGGSQDQSRDYRGGMRLDSSFVCEPVSNEMTMRAEQTRPPCTHYDRRCTMVAPCCGAAFGCRICHDDSPILPPLLIQKRAMGRYARSSSMPMNTSMSPEDTHHNIDRFAVKEVICRECYTKQSSKT